MKKLMAFRFDTGVIEQAKIQAKKENRNLTNWIETLIREKLKILK